MAATMEAKRDTLPADAREKLDAAVKEMTTDAGFLRWLDTRSKFHRYSFNNTLLIAIQRPESTQVMGFGDRCPRDGSHGYPCTRPEAHKSGWLSLGRHVRKGEKSIKILAPRMITVDAEGNRCSYKEPGARKRLVGFKVVSVFDVGQTEGESLGTPPEPVPLDGDAPEGMADMLAAVADAEGFTIDSQPLMPGMGGFMVEKRKTIMINANDAPAEQASSLAHELAHHFDPGLHDAGERTEAEANDTYMHGRGDCEAVAESAAYIVDAAFGVDAGSGCIAYVAGYSKGDPKIVQRLAERIDRAARRILGDKVYGNGESKAAA